MTCSAMAWTPPSTMDKDTTHVHVPKQCEPSPQAWWCYGWVIQGCCERGRLTHSAPDSSRHSPPKERLNPSYYMVNGLLVSSGSVHVKNSTLTETKTSWIDMRWRKCSTNSLISEPDGTVPPKLSQFNSKQDRFYRKCNYKVCFSHEGFGLNVNTCQATGTGIASSCQYSRFLH
jgi:hypothetical protein